MARRSTVRSLLFGTPGDRRRRHLLAVPALAALGYAWLLFVGVTEGVFPGTTALYVWFGVPALVATATVALFAYRGDGVVLGWALGAAFALPSTRPFWDPAVTSVENATMSLVLAGLFALCFGLFGASLGLGFRWGAAAR
ncbi:hypothetical protein [Halovivax sp.]|uniref:hypothetical protein n=1 Tax=Halovivax sp. TaxID=1935978 RepID=UPI0025C69B04|nr:hypothetical protein [Halovivax sp.]